MCRAESRRRLSLARITARHTPPPHHNLQHQLRARAAMSGTIPGLLAHLAASRLDQLGSLMGHTASPLRQLSLDPKCPFGVRGGHGTPTALRQGAGPGPARCPRSIKSDRSPRFVQYVPFYPYFVLFYQIIELHDSGPALMVAARTPSPNTRPDVPRPSRGPRLFTPSPC